MAKAELHMRIGDKRFVVYGFDERRSRNVTKIIVDGFRTYAVNARGEMFTSGLRGRGFITTHNVKTVAILDAAAKFGLLDKKDVAALKKEHDKRHAVKKASWAAHKLAEGAEELGVALPENIKRRVRRAFNAAKKANAAD